MEDAKELWEKLGLPALKPESPWHGYSLGDWNDQWDDMAKRAADGDYLENGRRSAQMRRTMCCQTLLFATCQEIRLIKNNVHPS